MAPPDSAAQMTSRQNSFRTMVRQNAAAFLSPSEARAAAARDAARDLFSKLSALGERHGLALPLPLMHTDGLDAEQVWMQIEMQLAPLLTQAKLLTNRLRPAIEGGDGGAPLLRVPARASSGRYRDGAAPEPGGGEGVEWEAFDEGVDHEIDTGDGDGQLEDGGDTDDGDDVDEGGGGTGGGKRSRKREATAEFFKDPGIFSLADMERFAVDAEDEAEEEVRVGNARANRAARGEEQDDEDEEDPLLKALDSEDDDDSEDDAGPDATKDDDVDDGMVDVLGYSAEVVGADAPSRTRKGRKGAVAAVAQKKKGKEIMFEDFFSGGGKAAAKDGGISGQGQGGVSGAGAAAAGRDADEDKLSDQQDDMFNDLEGDNADEDNDDGLSGNEDDDEDAGRAIDAFGAHDGDLSENEDGEGGDSAALLRQLETELADELAAEEDDEKQDSDGDGDGFDAATDDNEEEDKDEEEDDDNGASGNADDEEAAAALALAWRKNYAPSVFQRAQTKLSRQIETLEERALQEKTWLLKGEASARERPTNSVLEADLEFEHVQAPPPVVSEEMTAKLEDLVKTRIAEQRFDDVERVEPGLDGDRRRKALPELDDTISKRGLGELYADDYVKAKSVVEGKAAAADEDETEEPLVLEVHALFMALTTKLDALSHFHFAPKPVTEELTVKVDAPALEAEEVAPAMVSDASRKAPEEVFAGGAGAGGVRGGAAGDVKMQGEMSKGEHKAARAKRKRKNKAESMEQERVKAKRVHAMEAKEAAAEEAGFTRKAPKVAMLAARPAGGRSKSDFARSSKVFSILQDQKEADAAAGGGKVKATKSAGIKNKSALKL